MSKSTIVITHNRFPEIAAKLPVETDAAVRKAAHDVEGNAKARVPVDTGALKNSIYTKTNKGDAVEGTLNYSQAKSEAEAKAKTKNRNVTFLPEVPTPPEISAIVAVSVEYGAAVEFGRARGFGGLAGGAEAGGLGAQPYMTPAAEIVRPAFEAAMKQLLERL